MNRFNMGWQSRYIRSLISDCVTVINETGSFVYSGTPGKGNLQASYATVAGRDDFGNNYAAYRFC
jgi:fructose-1,6-bisphosphatase